MITHTSVNAFLCALFCVSAYAMEKEHFIDNIAIGGIAGATEVTCNQGLITIKNRAQQGKAITLNPKILYKGYGVNVGCMVPTTAIQVGFNKGLKAAIPDDSVIANVARSFCAGALSATTAAPCELVVITQQNNGGTALANIKHLYKTCGGKVFARGIMPTAIRDGGFTVGYTTLYPIIFDMLKDNQNSDWQEVSNTTKFAYKAGAGAAAGVITAAATHPADTIKTIMQADYAQEKYNGITDTVKKFYRAQGIKGFAKGFEARASRAACAIPVIYAITDYLSDVAHTMRIDKN